jgi:hypothetical protein
MTALALDGAAYARARRWAHRAGKHGVLVALTVGGPCHPTPGQEEGGGARTRLAAHPVSGSALALGHPIAAGSGTLFQMAR